MRRKIAAGNWKMNGVHSALSVLSELTRQMPQDAPDVVVCPPAPLLYAAAAETATSAVHIGAQDCHAAEKGAHTGDISAAMVADTGATHVIVGHSERRQDHHETDADIAAKATAAHHTGLVAIICLGESDVQRTTGQTLEVIKAQLLASVPQSVGAENTVIAYEPIWAIGTGKVPSIEQIVEVHDLLRHELTERFGVAIAQAIPLLYGGSVKPGNAAAIFDVENVDGALVGGASLKADDFVPIIAALAAS